MKSIKYLSIFLLLLMSVAACTSDPIRPPKLDGGVSADSMLLCHPGNCKGCCMGDACLSGTSRSACGWGGLACVICQGNEKCESRQCVPYSGTCDQFTCPNGCCQGKVCQPGLNNKACGKGGKACVPCAPDKTCVGGACGLSGACGTNNCTGCCSGSKCHPGTGDQFCGKGGQGCKGCPSTHRCVQGACSPQAQCTPKTCAGCCAGQKCQPGTAFHLCGKNGANCKACQTGQACNGGVCGVPPPQCTPANCSGCCSNNKCQPGTTFSHCGNSGNQCKQCPSGQQCVSGTCGIPPPQCTPTNCSGCCSGNKCEPGTTFSHCGFGGKQCSTCQAGQQCNAGNCGTPPPQCSSANCTGCCSGGTCNPGTTFSHCGKNGLQCTSCQSGQQCMSGACGTPRPTCGPGNCSGCCAGTACMAGSSTSACGVAGAGCKSCAKYEKCSSGSCGLDMYSKWSVVLAYANLLSSKSWDMGGKPDAYVTVTLGSQNKTSTIVNDTYYPTWNESMFTATATAIVSMQMKVVMMDSDVTWDQTIGTCYISVSKSDLVYGAKSVYSCDSNGYISTLRFKYIAQ